MSLKIRLSRGGAKKRPFYRIVVAESRFARDGRFVEKLGTLDPMLAKEDPKRVVLDLERIKHWLTMGALPTDRLARELSKLGVVAAPARREQTQQHMPRAKAQERMKAAAASAAKAAEA
jgi:small subunit ribosomal protein S16